jgi:hypothetical protein
MDVRKVFRVISKKLLADFAISAQMNHNGNKGDFRENSLKEFLALGRLPKRYGIGSGEIVGQVSNVSKQSDLIIFDQFESIPLIYDSKVQVYPIDSIYGIIEVKSKLSKAKLYEGLENIKSVKQLVPEKNTSAVNILKAQNNKTYNPFGFIFSFSVDGNSLDSLTTNLREWEKDNSPKFWPNLIVVLGEGIIYHTKLGYDKRIASNSIDENCTPISIKYGDDSFFYFYSYLLDISKNIELPKIEFSKYLNMPQQIGKYVVGNNDRMIKYKDGKIDKNKVYRLNEKFIDKIVTWCKSAGAITSRELYLKEFGQIPQGMPEMDLTQKVYLYNPDNLLGIHEVEDALNFDDKTKPTIKEGLLTPCGYITVDDEVYYYPYHYLTDNDSEPIENRTFDDL